MSLFGNRAFRIYWIANEFAHFAVWMNTVAVAWTMTQTSASSLMVASIQVAAALPIALVVLPAGIVADRWERSRFLLWVNLCMTIVGIAMAAAYSSGVVSPAALLIFTALTAIGMGANFPASQAMSADLVEPNRIVEAATLNTLGSNLARSFGPPIGSMVLVLAGPVAVFAYSAASRAALGMMYCLWSRIAPAYGGTVPTEPTPRFSAMLRERKFTAILLVTFTVFIAGSAFWALIPFYVDVAFGPDHSASILGWSMGATGIGAVLSTAALRRSRSRLADGTSLFVLCLICAMGLLLLVASHQAGLVLLASLVFGAGWGSTVAIVNGRAQATFSRNARARAISLNILAMYSGMGAGSLGFGLVSSRWDVTTALIVSAVLFGVAGSQVRRLF